jgi:exopolyphosphatase/pppGpp-phosphohydrolase
MNFRLHIGEEATTLARTDGPEHFTLPLGSARTARDHFRSTPPSAADLEAAIEAVEDVVMPLHRQMAPGARLASDDATLLSTLYALARGALPEAGRPATLGIDEVERVFNRLADVATGRPAASAGLPQDSGFAASLLILRELMHHLKFDALSWHPSSLEQGPP